MGNSYRAGIRGSVPIDLSGQKFGRLTAIALTGERSGTSPLWLCRCECGAETKVRSTALRAGRIRSCGCLRRDSTTTHGQTNTPTYKTWRSMILRCEAETNGSYANYGGRGIKVCPRWRDSFEAFLTDMGPRPSSKHSIDRFNADADYEPGNCRWATPKMQSRHRRRQRLTESAAAEIRRLYEGGMLQREIAERFGVDGSLISMVVTGHIWRPDELAAPHPAQRRIAAASDEQG